MDRNSFLAELTAWLTANPGVFEHRVDGSELTLLEIATGKQRVLRGDDVEAIREKRNRQSGVRYPILFLQGGLQLAITDLGFCFASSFASSGEIPGAPAVVSFGDFRKLFGEAQHAAADPDRRKDALDLLMLCITIIDGARDVGFDVGREEERLDRLLRTVEASDPPARPN